METKVYIFEDISRRYPVEMHKYAQSTGALFAHRIGRIFQILGFACWIVKGQNNVMYSNSSYSRPFFRRNKLPFQPYPLLKPIMPKAQMTLTEFCEC
jgi:hypothetical protein